jgi:hypothetical protein
MALTASRPCADGALAGLLSETVAAQMAKVLPVTRSLAMPAFPLNSGYLPQRNGHVRFVPWVCLPQIKPEHNRPASIILLRDGVTDGASVMRDTAFRANRFTQRVMRPST